MAQRGRKSRAQLSVIGIGPPVLRRQPTATSLDRPPPPDHLGGPERLIWTEVFEDYDLSTRASAAVLATALEAHQRAREAREAISREGMTVEGRDGQAKVHPLLAVERDARQAWLSGIKALGLEL
jgi:P27 family predicted phage terminase small subunit